MDRKAKRAGYRKYPLQTDLNGPTVQNGSLRHAHPVDDIIAYVSRYFYVEAGDLLFTFGTPAGQ